MKNNVLIFSLFLAVTIGGGIAIETTNAEGELKLSDLMGPLLLWAIVLFPLLYFPMIRIFKMIKSSSSTPRKKLNDGRGQQLDERLKEMEGERLSAGQRKIIADNVGLYHWLPEKLINPWEERILVFLENFHFTDMAHGPVTEEMRLLVASEACLLIVRRPLSDYRHLQRIHLWKDVIEGAEGAAGTATRHDVNLSWKNLMDTISCARGGYNLTLHEFAHVIDFADDGIAQSIPVGRDSANYDEWEKLVDEEHAKLVDTYDSNSSYPIRAYATLVARDGTRPEFFSCATSAFFERGSRVKRQCPNVYELFKKFYGVDPASWRKQKRV